MNESFVPSRSHSLYLIAFSLKRFVFVVVCFVLPASSFLLLLCQADHLLFSALFSFASSSSLFYWLTARIAHYRHFCICCHFSLRLKGHKKTQRERVSERGRERRGRDWGSEAKQNVKRVKKTVNTFFIALRAFFLVVLLNSNQSRNFYLISKLIKSQNIGV